MELYFLIFCLSIFNLVLVPFLIIAILYFKSRVTYRVPSKSSQSCVLITGCDSGIGKSSSEKLLEEGFHVIATVFTENGQESLEQFARSKNAENRLTVTNVDITNDESVAALQKFMTGFFEEYPEKKLVGLVNNAGIALTSPLEIQPMSQFRKQIDVNLTGHVNVSQVIIPFLRESQGRIVNIVSAAGRVATASGGAYCASKFGMEAITTCLRLELAPWKISVSAIEPGFVRTPLVENSIGKIEQVWDSLPPTAKTLYAHQLEKGKKSSKKIMGYAIEPKHVAKRVYHALTSPKPKTRYLIGYDAQIFGILSAILPDRFLDFILTSLS